MQAAADTGGLQAGQELRLAQMGQPNAVTAIATSYTTTALGDASGLLSDVAIDAAGAICSRAGYMGNFMLTPVTDCPVVSDPLAARPPPPVGDAPTGIMSSSGTMTLMPGVYCGGLHVTGGAAVTLSPGVYVMSNGPLKVDGGSSFTANGAGIYLTGSGATLWFGEDTTISLTAPTSGPMAGLKPGGYGVD